MNKGFVFGLPILAIAMAMPMYAHAAGAANQGARQDDAVVSSGGSGGGAAWIDCDKANQAGTPKCAKERQRGSGADTSNRAGSKGDKSTTVPMAGPEGKGVVRAGS